MVYAKYHVYSEKWRFSALNTILPATGASFLSHPAKILH
jgi:hypothetical protein